MRNAVLVWVVFHSILSDVDCCRKRILWCHAILHVEDYVVGLRGNEPAERLVNTMILESKSTSEEIHQNGARTTSMSRLYARVIDIGFDCPSLFARWDP